MELQTNLLPGRIRAAVENREPRAVSIGRSGARVWVFDDRVLKVERTSPAADREYELLSWLDGRAGAARVIDFERQEEFNYLLETRVPGVMTCDKDALQDPAAVTHALAQGLIALRDISVAELLPAAAVEGVVASASSEDIVARGADEAVIALIAEEPVVASVRPKDIVAKSAADRQASANVFEALTGQVDNVVTSTYADFLDLGNARPLFR